MTVYRLANSKYKNDLSGVGAKTNGARWNSRGISMLYTSSYISLSVLESLVHLDKSQIPSLQYLLSITIPSKSEIMEITFNDLKSNWQNDIFYTQKVGDEFIQTNKHLILKVPSVIINEEYNYVINPEHKNFHEVSLLDTKPFRLDERLIR